MKRTVLSVALSLLCVASFACTNLIVGKKASVDGSVICTYNCDGFGFASPLSYYPAGKHAPGEMVSLRGMGPGGEARLIPQVEYTYVGRPRRACKPRRMVRLLHADGNNPAEGCHRP